MIFKSLCAIITGFFSGLSFYHYDFSFLIWFSLTPLFYLIENTQGIRLFVLSFVAGISFFLTSIFWVGYVTRLGLFFLLIYLSIFWVGFSLVARFFIVRRWNFVSIPFLWIIFEFLRENLWTGFGWAILGYSQFRNLFLIQVADIFGVKFISWLIVMSNFVIYTIGKKKKFTKEAFTFLLLVIFCIGYSWVKLYFYKNYYNRNSVVKVSLIQTNISQQDKWNSYKSQHIIEKLKELGEKSSPSSLVIFPEASFPLILKEENYKIFENFLKELNRYALIGVIEKEDGKFYNEAMLVEKTKLIKKYRKIKLVPFGEYIPLRKFLSFISVINSLGDISAGREKVVFDFEGKRFSVVICFEDIFPVFISDFSKDIDFLVNITNDAWFLGEPEATQHLSILTFRAIENRVSTIRVANTGITAWISPYGEIRELKVNGKKIFVEGVFLQEVPLFRKTFTVYSKFPEFFSFLGVCFLSFVILKSAKY